ncbi:MAG TPA: Fe-S protein assembly co-chaperone HscB [Methylomirabilota bacterium]|jgi:molecular chaperone HscB|nr:Fe-S protein assembly co-chaperone HscB [Methylomirabilota bacterium]
MDDYFAVFGLPRKLQVDADDLQRRFYALSRRHHPDFHQLSGEAEQAAALSSSALINRAYRALRDPLGRVEYVIALEEGRETKEGAEVKAKAPGDLLEEMLEIQETLEEAKMSGLNAESRSRLDQERRRLAERKAAGEAALVALFPDWDQLIDTGGDRRPLLDSFKQGLATRAYLRTVIEDLDEALAHERQEPHVSHRRH